MDARKANAINRQLALEKQAAEQRQAMHEQRLAAMPEDLRGLYMVGLGFDAVRNALKVGMFPTLTHQHVAELRDFMHQHVLQCDEQIVAHPRFAEFFPAAAAKAEAMKAQRETLEAPAPVLVGPDGAPLELEPAPAILHLEDTLQ